MVHGTWLIRNEYERPRAYDAERGISNAVIFHLKNEKDHRMERQLRWAREEQSKKKSEKKKSGCE